MPRNPILLCAPTDALREHVETVLTDAGYVATAVKSAPDAVASLRDAPYDLVIAEGLAVSDPAQIPATFFMSGRWMATRVSRSPDAILSAALTNCRMGQKIL